MTDPGYKPPRAYRCWRAARFDIADGMGILKVDGFTYRGLGIHWIRGHVRHETWDVIHLNSGHTVRCLFRASREDVFMIATSLAELLDWSFNGLDGWRNTIPDLPERVARWNKRFPLVARRGTGIQAPESAQEISMRRQ